MAKQRLLLAGFGNVGRRFVEILADRQSYPGLSGLEVAVVAVTTGQHGAWANPAGLAPATILETYRTRGGFPDSLETTSRICYLQK